MINNTVLTSYIPVYSQALFIRNACWGIKYSYIAKKSNFMDYMASIKQEPVLIIFYLEIFRNSSLIQT